MILNLIKELQIQLQACISDNTGVTTCQRIDNLCTQLDVAIQYHPVDVALLSTITENALGECTVILGSRHVVRDLLLHIQWFCVTSQKNIYNYSILLDHVAKHIPYPTPLTGMQSVQFEHLYSIIRASEVLLGIDLNATGFDITSRHMYSNQSRQTCNNPKDIATLFQKISSKDIITYIYPTIYNSSEQFDKISFSIECIKHISLCFIPKRPYSGIKSAEHHPDILALVVIDVIRRIFHLIPSIDIAILSFTKRIANMRFHVQTVDPPVSIQEDPTFDILDSKHACSFLNEVQFTSL